MNRRRLLGLSGILGATMLFSTACTTDVVTDALPTVSHDTGEPKKEILSALGAVRARATENDAWAPMFAEQAKLVEKEYLRQCGTNSDGEHSPECVSALDEIPTKGKPAQTSVVDSLWTAATSGDSTGALTGVYAASYTSLPTASEKEFEELKETVIPPQPEGEEPLAELLDMTYAAIYATGVALAADGGNNRAVLNVVAARLRVLRDRIVDGFEHAGIDVPVPAAAYSLAAESQPPRDSATAADYLHAAILPITQQLRHLASTSEEAPEGYFVSWCGLMARSEAALEPLFGKNPRKIISRGDS